MIVLDPYQMTAAGTREVMFNVFEGLVKPDSDGNLRRCCRFRAFCFG